VCLQILIISDSLSDSSKKWEDFFGTGPL